ncbi:hypothetical protein GCM10010413_09630 [Promicromonospora sukumoe]|uniref:Uncharacterized protein n=1 Tax=Promicromonospora sukumoe TaxID=88382 RepID=A0A7W3J5I7_9MICO|nr:MafI family immunity protein [Promicromonospora sukumoe]MBA8806632.1 hypothetical protein [Promicromonospora sukumoe]
MQHPDYQSHQVIDDSVRAAARLVAGSLRPEQYDDVIHLLDHGEPGIALDTLCSHLYEDDIEIDDGARRQIAHAGELMGTSPLVWERLAPAPWPDVDPATWWTFQTGEPADAEHSWNVRRELEREIGVGHVLHGERFDVLARFSGADKVLLRLAGGRFAVVHPTWSVRAEPSLRLATVVLPDLHGAQVEVDRISDLG